MTAHRFLRSRNLRRAWAGAAVLLVAGLAPAAAQFPSPPGQSQNSQANSPFPAPPGQTAAASQANNPFPSPSGQQQQRSPSPFPAPGQASVAPGGLGTPSSGSFAPSQGGFGVRPGGFSQPPGGMGQPSEAQKVCLTFPAIREEVEKGAAGIRAASERKATRDEVCPLFKAFAAKEEKLVKFLTANQKLCGVPPNIITQVKQNHAKTLQIRNNVCSAAPTGGSAAPTLSDALGGPIIADDTSVKSGRGTFDTLTGNALQR
jgi:hypothetical protein